MLTNGTIRAKLLINYRLILIIRDASPSECLLGMHYMHMHGSALWDRAIHDSQCESSYLCTWLLS